MRVLGLCGVAVVLLGAALSAWAVPATRLGTDTEAPPQRLALLIGNSQYEHLNKLKNPKNDVDNLAAKLEQLGFHADRFYDLTHDQFVNALSTYSTKIAPGAIVLFYYSGHGVQFNGMNYLVPINMPAATNGVAIQGNGIPLDLIRTTLNAAKLSLIVLDACRTIMNFPAKGPTEGLHGIFPRGSLVAYAADEGQAASDNDAEDTSLFTKHFIKELDKHNETLCQLFEGVRVAVDEASGHVQFPFVYDGVIGEFIFNRTTTEESEEIALRSHKFGKNVAWTSIQNSDDPNYFAAVLTPTSRDPVHASMADARLKALMSSTAKAVGIVPLDSQEPPQHLARANQAERLFYEKAYELASKEYKGLLDLKPSDPIVLYDYATCLLQLGRVDEAIEHFSRAAELNPEFPWSFFNRGVAQHLKGNVKQAVDDYTRTLKARPTYAAGYNNLALAERDLGELTAAQTDVQKAISLDPYYAPAFFNGAEISGALGIEPVAKKYEYVGKILTIPTE